MANINISDSITISETTTSESGRYHIYLNSKGYVLGRNKRNMQFYEKKKAPAFVNKFGSGDSSYRDATFWQFFVQTNWRNGSQQLKYDDAGKFWKSENVNTSELEKLTLSKKLTLLGQLASGIKVNTTSAWRSSQSWWNANYGYRKQLTITANALVGVPANYAVKITEDTVALQTASKLLANRNDWRVVYWNGSSYIDLVRDYISTTFTLFSLQAAINAAGSDSNYYIYYGYAGETTNKQPTTNAEWNGIYFPNLATSDKGMWICKDASGVTITDTSGNSHDGTLTYSGSNLWVWNTTSFLGRHITKTSGGSPDDQYINFSNSSDFNFGSMTLEAWIYGYNGGRYSILEKNHNLKRYAFHEWDDTVRWEVNCSNGDMTCTGNKNIADSQLHHIACTHDGINTMKIHVDGEYDAALTGTGTPSISGNTAILRAWTAAYAGITRIRVSNVERTSFPYVIPYNKQPTITIGDEVTTQPPASGFDLYAGGSNGKMYVWNGVDTFTESFDCRRLEWYETGTDANKVVGDVAGVETSQAQSFKVDKDMTIKAIEAYLKKAAGTPGVITVRIETETTSKPSGTLVHANATTTIPAFTTTDYAWKEAVFTNTFTLTATTAYWLVLKTAAAANDINYNWAADASSPSYTDGNNAHSEDGGGTWTADATTDMYFRIKGDTTIINCALLTDVGATQKLLIGVGDPSSQVNCEARVYAYNGSSWSLQYTFSSATSSQVLSLEEYESKVYAGVGPKAVVYSTPDLTTWTSSKDINKPQNPGYIWALKEYNSVLYAAGGSPEFMPSSYYNGFIYTYDQTLWYNLYPFDFTVIRSMEFYDAYLFIGSYHGHLFVYDTASLTPLFNFKDLYEYKLSILDMKYYDDKLYIATYPQEGSGETNVGIWVYDRHGLSNAHHLSGVTGYRCMDVINNYLVIGTGDNGNVYKIDTTNYSTSGSVTLSYFDANLPSINKLYAEVTLKHQPLPTGTSFTVYYKYKEDDSWTTLGTSATPDDTEETITFPTGTYSKKICLKISLTTSDIAKTPTLEEIILKYTLYPTPKFLWNLRILAKKSLHLLDKTVETRTASEIRNELITLQSTQSLFTFEDVDGTQYQVLFYNLDETSWVINQLDTNEDQILITLLEA